MMNKRGFTLVELLAAIVILGLIVTIAYPVVISTIHSSEKKAYNSQVKIIEKAAKLYYMENSSLLKDLNENGTMNECGSNNEVNAVNSPVSVNTLLNLGYISDNETKNGNLINPCTNEPMNGSVSVKWICDKKQYKYEFEGVGNSCND